MKKLSRVQAGVLISVGIGLFASTAAAATINGQVFIVTRGQQAIKLPLVNVVAISETEMNRLIKKRGEEARLLREALLPKIVELTTRREVLEAEIKPVRAQALDLVDESDRAESNCISQPGNTYRDCQHLKNPAKKQQAMALLSTIQPQTTELREVDNKLKALKASYDAPTKPAVFFSGLGDEARAVSTTKSDIDGKFKLAVQGGKRIAVIAQASRLTAGETEEYRWLVWVPLGSGSITVDLANDNLLETGCPTCVAVPIN